MPTPSEKPIPSDPASRYIQPREGSNPNRTVTNLVHEVTVDGTAGTFSLTLAGGTAPRTWSYDTAAVAFDCTAATLQDAIEDAIGAGTAIVTGGPGDNGGTTPYLIEFTGPVAGQSITVTTNSNTGVNEVDTITIDATGGTFTISVNLGAGAQTTGAIAYNATASTVQTALIALSNLDTGDIVVTGGPGATNPYTLTFGGAAGEIDVTVTTNAGSLTGGAGTAAVVESTKGKAAPTITHATATALAITDNGIVDYPAATPSTSVRPAGTRARNSIRGREGDGTYDPQS